MDEIGAVDDKMPKQNTLHKNGPLIVYPNQNGGDSLEDIKSSLPSKLTNSVLDKHELFHSLANETSRASSGCKVDKWMSLFSNVFGKNTFELNNEKRAKEMKERILLYPHEEIDSLRHEADEEIDRLRRKKKMMMRENDDY
jgi:hypothetical protein